MCLEQVEQEKPIVAEKPISCYKIVYKTPEGEYVTPFKFSKIELSCLIETELQEETSEGDIDVGIHTIKSLNDTRKEKSDPWYTTRTGRFMGDRKIFYAICPIVILKAVIPKGSLYYIGKFHAYNGKSDEYYAKIDSYCSNQIIYLKELKS